MLTGFSFWLLLSLSTSAEAKGGAPLKANEVSLSWTSQKPHQFWLAEKSMTFDGPTRLAPLALVKKFEYQEKYEDCANQILSIWSRYPQFRGWMALQGTQCLVNQLKFSQPKTMIIYEKWWKLVLKQGDWVFFGPWSSELVRTLNEFSNTVIKEKKLPVSLRANVANIWRKYADNLNRAERLELYRIIVQAMDQEGQAQWSQAVAEREGLKGIQTAETKNSLTKNSKISSEVALSNNSNGNINSLLNDKDMNGSSLNNSGNSNSPLINGGVGGSQRKILEEEDLFLKFSDLLKKNQLAGSAEIATQIFDKFPNGMRAPTVQEKFLQAYFNLWDSNSSPEQKSQLDRCFEWAKLWHPSRLIEWARLAHRKADFRGAYFIAKQALLNEEKSPDGAALLFIIGRSAYFMGKYRESIEFFDRLIAGHSGYSEYWEVKFRRALALLRLSEDLKAVDALSELWMAPENKSYSLASLYWLIRVKQRLKLPVDELVQALQSKFSLSYYGLRLAAEMNQHKVSLPDEAKPVTLNARWVLTSEEKSQWERSNDLAAAGWYSAAQGELNNLNLSGGLEQKFLWVQNLVNLFSYPQAIKLMSDLGDLDSRWKKISYLKIVFPKPFSHVVQAEAQKNELNPTLVYSLIRQESAFYLGATSRSQAKGLMQLIPATVSEIAQDLRMKKVDSDQMYQPHLNLKFGIYFLSKVIRQFSGNVSVGLAAYNAGPQRLKRFFEARPEVENTPTQNQEDPWTDLWIEELPWLETNLYVKSILRNRVIYEIIDQGSFDWPNPVWKDLFLGNKKVSQVQ